MSQPLVTIIILNHNGIRDTTKCLKSIKNSTYKNYEILLIDNGSKVDESVLINKNYRNKKTKIFRLKKNLGFTGGNNWALKKSRGKYVVLLNNDTKVTTNWLSPLVNLLESDKRIAVAQPKIKLMQNPKYFDYSGAGGGFIDKYGYPFTRGRIFNTIEKDEGQYDDECNIFWASGAACIIRKSCINKVGGLFSENLFNYMEEIDFCWRIWKCGYKVRFVSKSVIYHKVASTSKSNLVLKRFWEHRNNLYILIRNLDKKHLLQILPVRMCFELFTYIYYIVSRQKNYTKSLYGAHKDFIMHGFYIRSNRNRNLSFNSFPIYPRSIIIDHYIKKRKIFSELNWSPKGNIIYLIYSCAKNTGNTTVFRQANRFKQEGYGVEIYSILGHKQTWFNLNVTLKSIFYLYFRIKPDVVIATFWPTAYFLMTIRAKKKYFFSQDWGPSMHDFSLLKLLAKYSYQLPVEKIVHSNFLIKKIRKVDKTRNIFKIKYCVLDQKYRRNYLKNKKINKNIKKINILSVITWYATCKGPDILEKAVKSLKSKNSNYLFTLVSREKKPYTKLVDKFISDPPKNTIIKTYKKSDILLMTSRTEGMPIPGLEAMASGCLVITTNSGGVLEYAKNNYNSIVVKNPSDIWEKDIIANLIKDKKRMKRFIINGYKTANKYWEDNLVTDLKKILFN
jgi:GT2 family glycosyltransferase